MKKFFKLALIFAIPVPAIALLAGLAFSPLIFSVYVNNDLWGFGILVTGPITCALIQTLNENGHIIYKSIERFLKD